MRTVVTTDFIGQLYQDNIKQAVREYLKVDEKDIFVICRNRYISSLTKGKYKVVGKQPLQWAADSEESKFLYCVTRNGIPFISFFDSERTLITRKKDWFNLLKYMKKCFNEYKKTKVFNKPILDPEVEKIIKEEIFDFFVHSIDAEKCGVKLTKGMVLAGKPGIGKTSILKWVETLAAEKKLSYKCVTSTRLISAMNDDKLAELFHEANIICFDDIDISFFHRDRNKNTCAILSAMDGPKIKVVKPILRLFTTNESLDNMDDAFIRPGRIDKFVKLQLPNAEMRRRFIDSWNDFITSKLTNEQKDVIVTNTEGDSFAWMENIKSELFKYITNKTPIVITEILEKAKKVEANEKKKVGF